MPRVNRVTKARKSQGKCSKCGCEIKAGDPYLYWAFMLGGRGGPKIKRCAKPECAPKPKDLTRSEFWQALYGLQEEKWEADTIEDLESIKDDVVNQLQELLDSTQEKFDNMPEGLQQGDSGNTLQERIDAVQGAIDELENVDISFEEPEEYKEQALEGRIDEIRSELSDVIENVSCS